MEQLIKVTYDNDRITVLARELHKFLEVGTKFQDWFKRMCEYGFTEGVDFNTIKIDQVHSQKRERTYSSTDYQLTIEMAKEISMIQRNEKGKQARQYFIKCENELRSRQIKLPTSPKEILALIVADNNERDQRITELEKKVADIAEQKKPWRDEMLDRVRDICSQRHTSHLTMLRNIYLDIEINENVRIEARLANLRKRYMKAGHSYDEARSLQKIDAVASDPRLRKEFERLLELS